VIRSIQFIDITDEPLIFTAGLDKKAMLWTLNGELRGELKQGHATRKKY